MKIVLQVKWNSRDIATCYKRTKYGCQYLNPATNLIQKWKRLSVDAPSRVVPSLLVFLPERPLSMYTTHTPPKELTDIMTSHCDVMTSRRDTTCHDMTWHVMTKWSAQVNRSETPESYFSTWRPWPLTYDLDPQTRSRYCQDTPSYQLSRPYVERISRESVNRRTDTQMDRQTGPILYPRPLTREGNETVKILI